MKYLLIILSLLTTFSVFGQTNDSVQNLNEVKVKGFLKSTTSIWVPAAVQTISGSSLKQMSNTSLVFAVNTIPGVRMEERSPGSYRLSIRGSLLRSPFGIRNIKVYWKDLPLTDAGGNTYLNLIDNNVLGKIEILKGPAGSIYGAGTGGVVTVEEKSKSLNPIKVGIGFTGGSFGLFSSNASIEINSKTSHLKFIQSHLQSDGYRQNTAMKRDMSLVEGLWKTSEKNEISALLWVTKIDYRTPGGLTLTQMQANPKQARPATSTLPSAVQQQAGVKNTTVFSGVTNSFTLSNHWQNTSSVIFSSTRFDNPFITNFESRNENNIGVRTHFTFNYSFPSAEWHWIVGMEWQKGFYRIDSSGNVGGISDKIKVSDDVTAEQQFVFSQIEVKLYKKWLLHTGLSINRFNNRLQRMMPLAQASTINFNPQVLPKFSLLYNLKKNTSLFLSVSKGYSAPSIAEIRPSAGGIYTGLQAEYGWNFETGVKINFSNPAIHFEGNLFHYQLNNAIVRRTNAAGAEYFINAGGTNQKGIELFLNGWLLKHPIGFIQQVKPSIGYTGYDFRFANYKVNATDFSGNQLTGVPNKVLVSGLDILLPHGFYENTRYTYTSGLPLTDLNDVFANSYSLWQGSIGWKHNYKKTEFEIFGGVDNIGNETYSLGNDLNAVGKRYYNPAPSRNYFAGIRINN
ncbi:MAG: TonB-dependent receptor [Chitinophagaceae bacterium]|nr:TonB-dependent receptor [Chitinophagaceae bacterium]